MIISRLFLSRLTTSTSTTTWGSPELFTLMILVGLLLFTILVWKRVLRNPKYNKIEEIKGKLVRKVIDKQDEQRNVRNIARSKYYLPFKEEGSMTKYYLTFETDKGIKSYTVSKKVYGLMRLKTKGIITYRRTKFISFKKL